MQHYTFTQIDSWFFRESRSMDGSGATALDSVFPPSAQTLLGALRTQIGERYLSRHNEHWDNFNKKHPLADIIGYGQDYAGLKAQGVWLYHEAEDMLYFPAPANVVEKGYQQKENEPSYQPEYAFFALPNGSGVKTDLGTVRLPELHIRGYHNDKTAIRDKPLTQCWISAADYSAVLAGQAPQKVVAQQALLTDDTRLGISRDNRTRRTEEGMLYQTKHCRLQKGWQVYVGLDGVATDYAPGATILRLGGEARMAGLDILDAQPLPDKQQQDEQKLLLPKPKLPDTQSVMLVLYLLTPLPDQRQSSQEPPLPGCNVQTNEDNNGNTYWQVTLADITVNIVSAVVDKVQRIGGWDMANHCSLPVRSYLPAGSCWYIQCDDTTHAQEIIDTLHLNYLTTDTDRALGYGQIAIGIAPDSNNQG